jgi:hypothetical protein
MCAVTSKCPGASDAATYCPAASVTTARSWLVAVLRMVIATPGITAFCASVTVPCRVAVDCARAGAATISMVSARSASLRESNLSRIVILRGCTGRDREPTSG